MPNHSWIYTSRVISQNSNLTRSNLFLNYNGQFTYHTICNNSSYVTLNVSVTTYYNVYEVINVSVTTDYNLYEVINVSVTTDYNLYEVINVSVTTDYNLYEIISITLPINHTRIHVTQI